MIFDIRKTVRRFAIAGAAVAVALVPALASAHTTIVLAGGQIVPGGYVNGQRIGDGPATDGTMVFTNADPVAYTIRGTCTTPATCGSDTFQVVVPALTPSQDYCKDGLRRGTYLVTGNNSPAMKGEIRVSPTTVSCAH